MKSFTLIEILIVIFLISILTLLFIPIGLNFYKSQQLETHSQGILQTIRRAQAKAMSVELDSSFGVYLTSENYTLFKGDSYLERDSQYDEAFDLPQIIKVSGPPEIVFLKSEGLPEGTSAFCEGLCTPCGELNRGQCRRQAGCRWFFFTCFGTCTSCDSFSDQTSCEDQLGCNWYPASRGVNIVLSSDSESRTININEIGRVNLQ